MDIEIALRGSDGHLCLILEMLGEIDLLTADPKRMRGETDLLTDPERLRPNLSGETDLLPTSLVDATLVNEKLRGFGEASVHEILECLFMYFCLDG